MHASTWKSSYIFHKCSCSRKVLKSSHYLAFSLDLDVDLGDKKRGWWYWLTNLLLLSLEIIGEASPMVDLLHH
jgi:hypothetical protein